MGVKVKYGQNLVFNIFDKNKDELIVNLYEKWSYLDSRLWKNYLIIDTTHGDVGIVFTGEVPKGISFVAQEKEQLLFDIEW